MRIELTEHLPIREYVAAGGVVVSETGERALVLRRRKCPGSDRRVEIRLPKGHVEPGETTQETALREVREETGLSSLEIVADMGHQMVEFDWKEHHHIRHESYFLLVMLPDTVCEEPEEQFERLWLPWDDALALLTFEAEREWIRRARNAWAMRLENVPQ